MICSVGLATVNSRKEPVCLNCSEGLVNVNSKQEPVHLKGSKGLVRMNGRISSTLTDGNSSSK